jgi:biotin carboxyl carrier protein
MKAKINKAEELTFYPNVDSPLNGKDYTLEVIDQQERELRVVYKGKKYNARLLELDQEKKEVLLKINGNRFTVELTDEYDELLKSMGMGAGAVQKVNELKAPMPGVVFEIKVKIGDTIKKDDPVLVLEAMKMENILKSPIDAVIKNIAVEKGDTVEKNRILVEFE